MSIIHEIKYVNTCIVNKTHVQVKDLGAKPCHVPLAITPQPIEDREATKKKTIDNNVL